MESGLVWFGLVSANYGFGLLVCWFETKPSTSLPARCVDSLDVRHCSVPDMIHNCGYLLLSLQLSTLPSEIKILLLSHAVTSLPLSDPNYL
jgi:hypothetical protein